MNNEVLALIIGRNIYVRLVSLAKLSAVKNVSISGFVANVDGSFTQMSYVFGQP